MKSLEKEPNIHTCLIAIRSKVNSLSIGDTCQSLQAASSICFFHKLVWQNAFKDCCCSTLNLTDIRVQEIWGGGCTVICSPYLNQVTASLHSPRFNQCTEYVIRHYILYKALSLIIYSTLRYLSLWHLSFQGTNPYWGASDKELGPLSIITGLQSIRHLRSPCHYGPM